MKLLSLLLPLVATTTVAARALPGDGDGFQCLSDADAEAIVATFSYSLGINGSDSVDYNAALDSIALPSYQEISDSIDFLAQMPLGSVTFVDRAADEANHTAAQAIYERETLNIWHTCDVITWRWKFTLYPGALPVQGINVFVLEGGLLKTTYIEFNSLVWAIDIGFTVTPPSAPPAKKKRSIDEDQV